MRPRPFRVVLAVFICGLLLFAASSSAQYAALDTTAGKVSSTGVIVNVNSVPSSAVSTVSSFPYFFPAQKTQSSTTAQLFPNFSQTSLSGTLLNTDIGDANSSVSAPTTFVFHFPKWSAYTIHGLAGSALGATFNFELKDLTAGTTLYSFSKTATSITLDSTGGSLTGTLIKGDSFSLVTKFEISSGGSVPPPQTTYTGEFEVDFTQAPEPTTAMLVPLLGVPWIARPFAKTIARQSSRVSSFSTCNRPNVCLSDIPVHLKSPSIFVEFSDAQPLLPGG